MGRLAVEKMNMHCWDQQRRASSCQTIHIRLSGELEAQHKTPKLSIEDWKCLRNLTKGNNLRHGARKANEVLLCNAVENVIGTYSGMLQTALYALAPRLIYCGSRMLWRCRRQEKAVECDQHSPVSVVS